MRQCGAAQRGDGAGQAVAGAMNHHFAASWLQRLSEKLEQLTEWSWAQNRQDALSQHKNLFKEFFNPSFQKTLALVDEQKKESFLKLIERHLYKFDDATQQFPLGCLCALLLHGKDGPQARDKVEAWVEFLLQRLRGSPSPDVVKQVVEECLSAPFQKFVPLMEERLRERLADGLGGPLATVDEATQKRLTDGLPLVLTRIESLVVSCTAELNEWLTSAPRFPRTPIALVDTLAKLEHPLIKFFTAVQAPARKEAFLVAVALAVQGLRTRFRWMIVVEPELETLGAELHRRFFTVDGNQVLEMWLSARLNKYNGEVVTRFATLMLDPVRPEQLRQRLLPLFPARTDAGEPEAGWIALDRPSELASALLAWIAECVPGSFCPQHTLQPKTLMTALQRVGVGRGFEVDTMRHRARLAQAPAPTQVAALPPPLPGTQIVPAAAGGVAPAATTMTVASALAHLQPGGTQPAGQPALNKPPILAPKAPVVAGTENVDNLTDLLLKEALEGVPPELQCTIGKQGKGVYTLGTSGKEVTLHTMNGRLFVYRINEVVRHMPIQQLLTEEGLIPAPGAPGAPPALAAIAAAPAAGAPAAALEAAAPGTTPAAAVDNTAVARIALQSKAISTGVTNVTTASLAQPGAPFTSRPEAAPQKSDPQALMSKRVEAATAAMDVSKNIVRRSINFEDEKFLRKLLKKGLKEDKQWQASFKEYCTSRGVSDLDPKGQDKDFIAVFIERNLYNFMTQEWAKKIIENKDDPDEKKEKKDKKDKKAKDDKKEKKRKAPSPVPEPSPAAAPPLQYYAWPGQPPALGAGAGGAEAPEAGQAQKKAKPDKEKSKKEKKK